MNARLQLQIVYGLESFEDAYPEGKPLLEAHWAEIAHYPDIPFNPNVDRYRQMDAAGALRIFTARNLHDHLVGYAVYFVAQALHYAQSKQAHQDVLYVNPAFRHGTVGYRLIYFADKHLAREGVQCVYHHVKLAHDFGPMLKRLGYEPIDTIYGRRLDGHQ